MNDSTFLVYKDLLYSMTDEDFSRIKFSVLSSRSYFRSLGSREVVCPVSEQVWDSELCKSCRVKPFCHNFKDF